MKTFLQSYKPALSALFLGLTIAGNAQFQQAQKIVGERESRAEFGTSVAIDDEFAIVGTSRESIAAGAAYVYRKEGENWNLSQKIVASDAFEMAEFGGAVKLGNSLMVIAAGRSNYEGVDRTGALYVHERVGNTWVNTIKLNASDYTENALLGVNPTTLDLQDNTIVAGAPGENNWLGSVYVFEKEGNDWNETKILHPELTENATFGIGVSISGNTLIAGASGEDNGAGSAYIFQKIDGNWEFAQRITASDPQTNTYFGNSVSIDGNQLVVGAYAEGSVGGNIAAAYIFEKNDADEWVEIQKIPSPVSAENTYFGWMCKMEGNQMLISAPHIYGEEAGEVYLYNKTESGQWEEAQLVETSEDVEQKFYGWSIDLNGGNLIIGAPRDDFDENGENEMNDAGSAYIFKGSDMGVVENNSNFNSIKIYPNPAESQLNIESKEIIKSVEIFNLSGQKIGSTKQNMVNVSSLPKGTYIIKVSTVNGNVNTQKFIKK
ncbi:T9SS type A sorting domain-containing protein [Moheibacter sediminis]|uniref:Por secretion system C-terminal sorting domain-containing protein n=1 Tax=Moheibacter sediminis TaxID=1434700 RepID=A0A1W1Y8K4_9FLAO|nr:T9SS type A sorting domain-containing protein [Moheibacter sediminis]SMC32476.1 Por secretion system C-terminal sorting domain-containing protein [Moheibacter sediminis]